MKKSIYLILVLAAIISISFTFSTTQFPKKGESSKKIIVSAEPVGGFVADEFKK
jgi:hypothetical protein